MPTIKLYNLSGDLTGRPPIVHDVPNLGEWLLETYSEAPRVRVQVFRGEPTVATEITQDTDAIVANDAPIYTVLESPGGSSVTKVFSVFFPFWGGSVLGAQAALNSLTPALPKNKLANSRGGSPNNDLSDRSNKVRILERIEDIFGTVRSIPSLIAPTYTKYINHIQYEYAYLCVGRGYYEISDLKDGETPLADIDGAKAAVFDPFTSPNSGDAPVLAIGGTIEDDVLTVSRSNEIDGVTLKAPNQVQLPSSGSYHLIADPAGDQIEQETGAQPSFESVAQTGDQITISMSPVVVNKTGLNGVSVTAPHTYAGPGGTFSGLYVGATVTVSGFADSQNNGVKTVTSVTSTTLAVAETLVNAAAGPTVAFSQSIDLSGTYEVDSVAEGLITLTTSTFPATLNAVTATVQLPNASEWTSWVTLPHAERTQVWANVVAANGMYKDKGKGKINTAVTTEIQIERLDSNLNPTGQVETVTESIAGATTDLRATTVEHVTSFAGPCRVRVRRQTDYDFDFGGAVVDEIKFADLYAVSPVDKSDFGNVTTIQTVTKATLRALAAKERQLNMLASRRLPIYNGSTFSGAFDSDGRHVSGTISATSRFVDIIAAVSVDPTIGGRDLSTDIDMPQLYATYQQIAAWGEQYAEFNYTLDDDNLSFEETVRMIANAVFCVAYRQNGKIRFAFDCAQSNPVVPTFCHRNKKPDSETLTRNFAADSDYDGVEMVYMDPDTERNETIKLPLGGTATKYKRVELPGIRHFSQAWMRANREYNRLRYQRMGLETVATTDARALLPNSRIDVVDDTRFRRFGGEVLAQDGLTLTLSQPVEFTSGEPHSILLKRRDGTSEGISVTAGPSPYKVVLQSLPGEEVVTTPDPDTGIRTIYSFASDSQRSSQAWLVQEIIAQDRQYVQIRAINYSDAYYQADTQPIPDKNTVIYS